MITKKYLKKPYEADLINYFLTYHTKYDEVTHCCDTEEFITKYVNYDIEEEDRFIDSFNQLHFMKLVLNFGILADCIPEYGKKSLGSYDFFLTLWRFDDYFNLSLNETEELMGSLFNSPFVKKGTKNHFSAMAFVMILAGKSKEHHTLVEECIKNSNIEEYYIKMLLRRLS